jgi:hypothetical protein
VTGCGLRVTGCGLRLKKERFVQPVATRLNRSMSDTRLTMDTIARRVPPFAEDDSVALPVKQGPPSGSGTAHSFRRLYCARSIQL